MRFSGEFEEILNLVAKEDDWFNDTWMDFIANPDYETLIEFFDKGNFYDTWEDEPLEPKTVEKNLKKVVTGKDKLSLIQAAFFLGKLVGYACHSLKYRDD